MVMTHRKTGQYKPEGTWAVEYNPEGRPGRKYVRKPPKSRVLKDGTERESFIQARILRWLESSGYLHWRQQSGNVILGRRCIKMGPEGLPDIVVIVPPNGHLLGLEVKSASGTVRPSQKAMRAVWEANGASYVIVRSLEEAQNAVALHTGQEIGKWKLRQPSALQIQPAQYGSSVH